MKYTLAILFLLLSLVCKAQAPESDTTRQESVLHYKMISRYRPENDEFSKGSILSNTWISLMGIYYRPYADNYGMGPLASVGFGKWFTKTPSEAEIMKAKRIGRAPSTLMAHYHGVFLAAGAGYFRDNYYGERVKTLYFRLSYLFDISSYVAGYSLSRPVSVVAVAGLGLNYGKASSDVNSHPAFTGHIGVQFVSHLAPHTDFVIEPLFELHQEGRNLVRQDNWRKYIPVFKGSVGINYNIDRNYHSADPGLDWRVSISGGGVMLSSLSGLSMSKKAGPEYLFGIGRAYSDYFQWRLSVGYAAPIWGTTYSEAGILTNRGKYMFARMDALYDILHLIGDSRRFEIAAVIGPEAGYMEKTGSGMDKDYYIGLGGGMRFLWKAFPRLGIYIEPRYTIVPYQTWSNKHEVKYSNYVDKLLSMSIGLEYVLFKK